MLRIVKIMLCFQKEAIHKHFYITKSFMLNICSRNTTKTVHDRAPILGAPGYTPKVCSMKFVQIGENKRQHNG